MPYLSRHITNANHLEVIKLVLSGWFLRSLLRSFRKHAPFNLEWNLTRDDKIWITLYTSYNRSLYADNDFYEVVYNIFINSFMGRVCLTPLVLTQILQVIPPHFAHDRYYKSHVKLLVYYMIPHCNALILYLVILYRAQIFGKYYNCEKIASERA